MGIVVLRSTTPCVAVSSRSNSNLLTVISIVVVATAGATSTGILGLPTRELVSKSVWPRVRTYRPADEGRLRIQGIPLAIPHPSSKLDGFARCIKTSPTSVLFLYQIQK